MRFNKLLFNIFFGFVLLAGMNRAMAAESDLHGIEIEPPKQIAHYTLTDQNGKPADFPGNDWQLVFFGFTSCPNVCPVTLSKAMRTHKQLGANASKLKIAFVTVDPDRDTPEVIKRFLDAHNSAAQGLTGELELMQTAGKEFDVVSRRYQDNETGSFRIEHSSFLYLLNPKGQVVMFYPATAETNGIADDIQRLLSANTQ